MHLTVLQAYPRADTLKRHILSFHEGKKMYKCDVCNKSFKGHIKDHMRTHATDTEEKPFSCGQCGARFNQRSQLTVHMRVHTGERPYSCKICSRSFSHSTALKLHLRMHTGEKPHVCKLCNKVSSSRPVSWSRQIRVVIVGIVSLDQNNISTPVSQAFAQLPHLKKHMLCVHNTDKPYYCEKCEGFFKVKTEYEEHAARDHPEDLPDDLQPEPVATSGAELNSLQDIHIVEVLPAEEWGMPLQKMRTLLALLLKKISTPGRLKKLGFGTRLIDQVCGVCYLLLFGLVQ